MSPSGTPTPVLLSPGQGYAATPTLSVSSPSSTSLSPNHTPASKPSVPPPKVKAANVFSNDGSFLERFQHLKKDEEEKKKQEEALARKREFDNRFKQRGKRRPPPETSNSESTDASQNTKKVKLDEASMTQYQREVQNYAGRSLKDDGIGVRPLVK